MIALSIVQYLLIGFSFFVATGFGIIHMQKQHVNRVLRDVMIKEMQEDKLSALRGNR